jgi:DNA-binding transcriptional ArsR family regulator
MHTDPERQRLYPDDIKVIASVETLRVVADPLRLRLLALLRRAPATAKELARSLGTPLKGLYYHLALLEEHELLRVRATRVVSGIIEKQYEATAYRITVDRALFHPEPSEGAGLEVFLSFVLDHARAEILRSVSAGLLAPHAPSPDAKDGGLDLGRIWLRLTPAQREELARRTQELHMEFADRQPAPEAADAQYYELLVGIYPVIAPPERGEPS